MSDSTRAHVGAVARAGAAGAGSFVFGLLAAPLPERWRNRVPLLATANVEAASIPAALLQLVAGLTAFAFGYVRWIEHQYVLIDQAAAARGNGGTWDVSEQEVLGRALLLGNPVMPFVYLFTSPLGFALATTVAGGVVRLLHGAITRDVMPDPVLGLIDWGITTLRGRHRVRAREKSKDRSPDRVVIGTPATGFMLRIETAADLDWNLGNTVRAGSELYRVKTKGEIKTPAGLRIRYDLEAMPTGEPIRGAMRLYEPAEAPVVTRAEGESAPPA